jgi:hypothetical protein
MQLCAAQSEITMNQTIGRHVSSLQTPEPCADSCLRTAKARKPNSIQTLSARLRLPSAAYDAALPLVAKAGIRDSQNT